MISIVIPVFNTEIKLLKRCLDSIDNQSYKDYEIIVIDNASSSDFSAGYRQLCSKYENCNLYFEKQPGVSRARNAGIRYSKGDYISFVDSDDEITEDFLVKSSEYAKNYNADVIIGSILFTSDNGDQSLVDKEIIIEEKQIFNVLLAQMENKCSFNFRRGSVFGSPCGRIYKASVIKNIFFNEDVAHFEDQLFNRNVFINSKKIIVVPDIWYVYYQYDSSAIHHLKGSKEYIKKYSLFWNEWYKMNIDEKNPIISQAAWSVSFYFFNAAVCQCVIPLEISFKEKLTLIRELLNMPLFKNAVKYYKFRFSERTFKNITYLMMKFKLARIIYFSNKLKKR